MGNSRWVKVLLGAFVLVLSMSAVASAAPTPGGYQGNGDGQGFNAILPPGENGFIDLPDLIALTAGSGSLPKNSDDQLAPYTNLISDYPSLNKANLNDYWHDASFGVKPGDVVRTYSPRDDVTIQRDKLGIPHIYGSTRAGTMFGAGYAGAEDRLFFMDALRHAGRGELANFAGGANAEMDAEVWSNSPYTEADLEKQFNYTPPGDKGEFDSLRNDVTSYVAGINKYIAEARLNPAKMPGEYAATGHPLGPNDWKVTDVIATAALVGGIFGKGGGREIDNALTLEAAKKKFNDKTARKVFSDFREANDPEAPVTVHGKRFPYQNGKKNTKGRVLPDPGTTTKVTPISAATPGVGDLLPGLIPFLPKLPDLPVDVPLLREENPGVLGGLGDKMVGQDGLRTGASNALLVSGRESRGGAPVMVAGPQVSYFAPQILMEEDLHGPGISARGASFVGVSLYVLLGRGNDYSFSATSSGQDIIDTFAVPLCEADGSTPTKNSNSYMYRGQCTPMEKLEKVDAWTPNLGDSTAAGAITLTAYRTKLGLVAGRALVKGKPVAFTKLRSTYMHEAESAVGFSDFNNPDQMQTPKQFQNSASKIGMTFNWLYANRKHIAYFNSGDNPLRAKHVAPDFPVSAKYEWQNFRPDVNEASYTPPKQHPQAIDQQYLTSWNNKQAKGYRAADDTWSYGSSYRSITLDKGIKPLIKGKKKASLVQLGQAMENAATVDLRGITALPYALKIIGRSKDPVVKSATKELAAWLKSGAHRRDADRSGTYEQSNAIRIMDAWWEPWMKGEFEPRLGSELFDDVASMNTIDDTPNHHQGSAYNGGFYEYANKDLRMLLQKGKKHLKKSKRVKGPYSRIYCGKGKRSACRKMLISTLKVATTANPYVDPAAPSKNQNAGCGAGDDQMCFDAIHYRPLGGIKVPDQPWQNRPTFQQAVQVGGVR